MRFPKVLSIFLALVLLLAAVVPVSAQLGSTDISSFTVQNISADSAQVTVIFVTEDGQMVTPTVLNSNKANPFTLAPGESFEVYLPGIPADQLPDGRYSVVISSTAQVAAIANLVGQGNVNFNGSYSGFSQGASPFYLPAIVYNYYGWYSMISVQNVGDQPTNITVAITCNNGTQGSLTASNVPAMAAEHFVLKDVVPTGFTASTSCNGSASVTSSNGQPVVVVDNQSVPGSGNTQSFGGIASGETVLYAPALYTAYYGWNASLNIRKLSAGATTVTVDFSDTANDTTCDLTDAQPSCLVYVPSVHPASGQFAATITSNNNAELVAVANAANGAQAQTYNAVGQGSNVVGIPSVMKAYFGWNTSFTCQNVSDVATALNIDYANTTISYDTAALAPGASVEIFQPAEANLPNGFQGGVTVTAVNSAASVNCIVNFNNLNQMNTTQGDWSMSYNAFGR